ncbi:MAG TPA: NAD(P)/FAD-dependent oxidoreductase, partial [Labilithrix sp.]
MTTETFDVAVCGASLSGCAAAILLARKGLRVVLLEKSTDVDAYKKTCTHFIQPSARPTLERLGLDVEMEKAGAVRTGVNFWTPHGWIPWAVDGDHWGYNFCREKLDPMIRKRAAETHGVELLLGHSVSGVEKESGRVVGVVADDKATGKARAIRAKLVVAADGRYSKIADMAGVPKNETPHNRFVYFAYYDDIALRGAPDSTIWLAPPNFAYAFPGDGGRTLLAAFVHKNELATWKGNVEKSFLALYDSLARAPDLRKAKRVSEFLGMIELPNHTRDAWKPGIAFVGDAALTSDPVFGIGCGWALQSADWLAETANEDLDDASLARYAATHAKRLRPHHAIIADLSGGRPLNVIEKLTFSACTR